MEGRNAKPKEMDKKKSEGNCHMNKLSFSISCPSMKPKGFL